MSIAKLVTITSLLLLSACASIIDGTKQKIMVNTNPSAASCALVREGVMIGQVNPTPGAVEIQKTKHDITINCAKPGYQNATYLNHSGNQASTVGNIILGGGIGWAVDSARGADNKYESPVNITLVPELAPAAVPAPAVSEMIPETPAKE